MLDSDESWHTRSVVCHEMFSDVLKKFFTELTDCENNTATRTEDAMKEAMKTLLSTNPRGVIEDLVGVVSLFVLVFAMLSLPSLA